MSVTSSFGIILHEFKMNDVTKEQDEERKFTKGYSYGFDCIYHIPPKLTKPPVLTKGMKKDQLKKLLDEYYGDPEPFETVQNKLIKDNITINFEKTCTRVSEKKSTIIRVKKQGNHYITTFTSITGTADVLAMTTPFFNGDKKRVAFAIYDRIAFNKNKRTLIGIELEQVNAKIDACIKQVLLSQAE